MGPDSRDPVDPPVVRISAELAIATVAFASVVSSELDLVLTLEVEILGMCRFDFLGITGEAVQNEFMIPAILKIHLGRNSHMHRDL